MSVLVTGARGAIGSAVVGRFVAAGERVLAQDLDATDLGGSADVVPVSGNLLDPSTLARIAGLADDTQLTAVVAAHGIAGSNALPDCSDAFVDRVLAVNWTSVPVLYAAVEDALRRARGTYVVVSSQAALGG